MINEPDLVFEFQVCMKDGILEEIKKRFHRAEEVICTQEVREHCKYNKNTIKYLYTRHAYIIQFRSQC